MKVAIGSANLSDLRAIRSAIVLYKNAISLLYDAHFSGDLQVIDGMLMKDFSSLDGLYNELNTAVGELISEYSVMQGYSNKADELTEKLDNNAREVDKLKDHYRYFFTVHVSFQLYYPGLEMKLTILSRLTCAYKVLHQIIFIYLYEQILIQNENDWFATHNFRKISDESL